MGSGRSAYERAKAAAAARARQIAFGHPTTWPEPRGEAAQDAFDRDFADSFDRDRNALDDMDDDDFNDWMERGRD